MVRLKILTKINERCDDTESTLKAAVNTLHFNSLKLQASDLIHIKLNFLIEQLPILMEKKPLFEYAPATVSFSFLLHSTSSCAYKFLRKEGTPFAKTCCAFEC